MKSMAHSQGRQFLVVVKQIYAFGQKAQSASTQKHSDLPSLFMLVGSQGTSHRGKFRKWVGLLF
jgi:hypothetical protein